MAKVYPGINICFLYGRIISDIDLKFFYNSKIHNSIVEFEVEVDFEESTRKKRKQTLQLKAFDSKADWVYRKYHKDKYIKIIGELTSKYIEVREIV